jgi:hypothetical protein
MKVVCECGKECPIHCPPMFLELSLFFAAHNHFPRTATLVCACGEERVTGPRIHGNDPFAQGVSDAEWFEKHIPCDAN